jgi:uncharacterized protein (TIGR03118 family)
MCAPIALLLFAATTIPVLAQVAGAYKVTNILSDGSVAAVNTDANFIDPWGISVSGTWWISANVTGFNYVVPSTGVSPFKVIVPAASGLTTATGQPTGSVTTRGTADTAFILPNATKASFLFSTLDGTISGWNSKLGTNNAISQIVVNKSASNTVYTGLAMLVNSTGSYLLAPNFGATASVDIFDGTFAPATLPGAFKDPSLPSGYAPYSIHVIGTQVYIAYAIHTTAAPFVEVLAPGNGIVSLFDVNGNFVSRVVTGGNLNAPWGVAIAPSTFGIYANDLLIGNFGDGTISAYDPKTFAFLGQLVDATGKPFVYLSLWDLLPGASPVNGTASVSAGTVGTVYFTAGLLKETHGLLAGIANDTSTSTPAFGITSSSPVATVAAGGSTQVTVSVAPIYGFSGAVTLGCTNLPVGVTCSFSPAQLTLSPNAPGLDTVTIQTTKASAALRPFNHTTAAGITSALLLPFASLLMLRRRHSAIRLLGLFCVLAAFAGVITGCSNNTSTPGTPAGVASVVVTATGGTLSQATTVKLTVQ